MFFLGILLSVEALNAAGLLQMLAAELNKAVPDVSIVAAAIGVASAVIDNVSLGPRGVRHAETASTSGFVLHLVVAVSRSQPLAEAPARMFTC